MEQGTGLKKKKKKTIIMQLLVCKSVEGKRGEKKKR